MATYRNLINKVGVVMTQSGSGILSKSNHATIRPCYLSPMVIAAHSYHLEQLNTNMQLITNEKVPITKTLEVLGSNDHSRPLALLYSWTLSKDRHIKKYANFYIERGIDVLRIKTLPYDLLFPKQGGQVVAKQILDFLKTNYISSPLFVHGFSVGAYAFGELMLKVKNDEAKDEILKRFSGQIWDSAVDVHGLPEGLSRALSSNHLIASSLEKYFKWYMRMNKKDFTIHIERAAQEIYDNTVKVPGLWIYSEADLVSPPKMNIGVYSRWIKRGEPTFIKCFQNSPHVSHYYKYDKEYEELMTRMLNHVGLLPNIQTEKMAVAH